MDRLYDAWLKIITLRYWGISRFKQWHKEVWKWNLDAHICCDGYMCGCYGSTLREQLEYFRKKPIPKQTIQQERV